MYHTESYETPLSTRYSGEAMKHIFSDYTRHVAWRRLWINLAVCEKELGLNISSEQISEMVNNEYAIDEGEATKIEGYTNHDVVAHIKLFASQCPKAAPIIHLGATSCYITDNTDVVLMNLGLKLIKSGVSGCIDDLKKLADKYKDTPALAYTHYQAAQPTTMGKRMAMWIQDLMIDLRELDHVKSNLMMLGCRGATGTSASFVELFDGDLWKVDELEQKICDKYNMKPFPVSGQTYTRKQDILVLQVLAGIAESASKIANDIRLLAHDREVFEPYASTQVGSSAMPYKHNPMLCERVVSLGRYVMCNVQNTYWTASTQWLERTLDDSANRRIVIPESFLAVDGIIRTLSKVILGLSVDEQTLARHVNERVCETATEGVLMWCVKNGMDRQEMHEKMRNIINSSNGPEDTRSRVIEATGIEPEEYDRICGTKSLVGMAPQQTERFLREVSLREQPR